MEKAMVFETGRLLVRKASPDDSDLILSLWTDPRVMANVGFPQGLKTTRQEILSRIEQDTYELSPFDSLLVAELKSDWMVIGQCLMHLPDEDGIASTDIKLLPAYWGQKYGSEIKRGLVDYLFSNLDCLAVDATPNVENIASIRMQESVGAVRIGEAVHTFPESMDEYTQPVHHYIYRVYRAAWEQLTKNDR
jgi:ribosomal-protein-alanine N-acetyltransferase